MHLLNVFLGIIIAAFPPFEIYDKPFLTYSKWCSYGGLKSNLLNFTPLNISENNRLSPVSSCPILEFPLYMCDLPSPCNIIFATHVANILASYSIPHKFSSLIFAIFSSFSVNDNVSSFIMISSSRFNAAIKNPPVPTVMSNTLSLGFTSTISAIKRVKWLGVKTISPWLPPTDTYFVNVSKRCPNKSIWVLSFIKSIIEYPIADFFCNFSLIIFNGNPSSLPFLSTTTICNSGSSLIKEKLLNNCFLLLWSNLVSGRASFIVSNNTVAPFLSSKLNTIFGSWFIPIKRPHTRSNLLYGSNFNETSILLDKFAATDLICTIFSFDSGEFNRNTSFWIYLSILSFPILSHSLKLDMYIAFIPFCIVIVFSAYLSQISPSL